MSTFDAVLAQYEKNKNSASGNSNKMSSEDRLKRYFATILPKGVRSGERRIRILPSTDGGSPFVEAYFHEVQVDGNWVKLYDPKQDGLRSPLNEVYEGLMLSGTEQDRILARQYRARKFYIVKVIDRENEQDGIKFWRFKHNSKGDGVLDKIFPIFKNKGDITNVENGRDLIITLGLTKAGNGREYTTITSIMYEDPSPLHTDSATSQEWANDESTWRDVYSVKPLEYLEMVAQGDVPQWDSETKKYVSSSQQEETASFAPETTYNDPQVDQSADEDLPF